MQTKRLVVMAMLTAVGVAASHIIWFPAGVARAFPVQHAINVVAGVLLGPGPAVFVALATGILRNLLGIGTLLAFPGGMVGAFLAGWFFQRSGRSSLAVVGEVLGSGLIGALISVPVARILMGDPAGALAFVPSFTISAVSGAAAAFALLRILRKSLGEEEIDHV